MTETTMKQGSCRVCGHEFAYEPVTWSGRELTGPTICDRCSERMVEANEAVHRRAAFERRVMRSGLPPARQDVLLEDLADPIAKAATEWAEGVAPGLAIVGPVGVGKTHVAAAACWERLQRTGVHWVRCAPLMVALGGSFADDARRHALSLATGTGDIVLDDIDKVRPTDYGREVLYTLIDSRIEYGSALLVTANASLGEIGKQVGDAIASRLAGYCRTITLRGSDRRLAK